MTYDLDFLHALCAELGLSAERRSGSELAVIRSRGGVLLLANLPDNDSIIGFEGTPWHAHDDIGFTVPNGTLMVGVSDILVGLADGTILVAEHWQQAAVVDTWLVHRTCNDALAWMHPDEELRFRRF